MRTRAAVALAALMVAAPAQAYVDPGTGSLLLQGLLAAVASVSVVAGLYWSRIKRFVRRLVGRGDRDAEEEAAPGRDED